MDLRCRLFDQQSNQANPQMKILGLAKDGLQLELKNIDICFLAALHLRADETSLTSFEEDLVFEIFEEVCQLIEPNADNPKLRATNALQRLRDQRMLTRVDGAGIVRAGEYVLTRLASAVVDFFLSDEALTKDSLTVLNHAILDQIADIVSKAKKIRNELAKKEDKRKAPPTKKKGKEEETPEQKEQVFLAEFEELKNQWRSGVITPLRITVSDLLRGIERRQKGLDDQQSQVQTKISGLLQSDWFDAIDRCQSLLDTTTQTLRELNEILLRDASQFQTLLQELSILSSEMSFKEAEEVVQQISEQVDRISTWGMARQKAWSEYYQYVHRYLRDVVRLDPQRALSQRLRDQLNTWANDPFALIVAYQPSILLLRPIDKVMQAPAVGREISDREHILDAELLQEKSEKIEILVKMILEESPGTLAEVTDQVIALLPAEERFSSAGIVFEVVTRLNRGESERERPWVPISQDILIEDWQIRNPSIKS